MKGLYEKRGWWYFQPPKTKGEARAPAVALGTRDYLEAATLASRERDLTQQQFAARHNTLAEILPRYLRDKAEHKKATRQQREHVLSGFQDILGNPRIDKIDAEMMEIWWRHLGEKGGSVHGRNGRTAGIRPTSKKSYLIVVRAFLNWAIAESLLRGDPLKRLRSQTRVVSTRVQEFLTEEKREELLEASAVKPYALRLLLHLGFFAGLRDSEMLAMKPHWVWISPDGDRGTIAVQDTPIEFRDGSRGVWQPKGKRKRTIPMHPRLLEFFKNEGLREPYLIAPEKPLWPSDKTYSKRFDQKKALYALGEKHGIKLNHHILRHSFATHLAMKGVMLAQIAGLLGDGIKVTEDHYAGFCPARANPLAVL